MSEYIKREDALKTLIDAIHNDGFAAESRIERRELREDEIDDAINAIPAADVEPVVRCPNCVNGQRENNVWTRCAKDGTRRLDNFYCAHGKERER